MNVRKPSSTSARGTAGRRAAAPLAAAPFAAACLAVTLAGCSGASSPATLAKASSAAPATVAPAASPTASASAGTPSRSATPASAGTVDGTLLAQKMAAAIRSKRSTVLTTTQTVGNQVNKGTGVLRYLDDGIELSLTMTVGAEKLRMIIVPQAFYVAGPTKVQGKTWVKISSTSGSDALAQLADQVLNSVNYDTLVKPLTEVAVTAAGRSRIHGVQVTKYTFSLTEQQFVDQFPAAQRSAMGDQFKGVKALQAMWVDDSGLPAVITFTTTVKGVTTTQTSTYSSWGSKVAVTLPPAADVLEAPAS